MLAFPADLQTGTSVPRNFRQFTLNVEFDASLILDDMVNDFKSEYGMTSVVFTFAIIF